MAITMKAARVNAGLTQPKAAQLIGISKSTLAGYENGKVIPKMDVGKKMAEVYGVSVDDIIFF